MKKPKYPRHRYVKSRKWYRRRNKWLNKPPAPWPPPITEQSVEWLCDGDGSAWEDHNLLFPLRFIYKLDDVIRFKEGSVQN